MWEELERGVGGSKISSMDSSRQHDAVFSELMRECKHSAPGARLSARLRTALERMSPAERRAVVRRKRDGCAPLFVACKRGNVELVEYLVHVCAAELEQRGVYEVQSLFVACKRGNVELVEYLVHVCAAELEQRGVYEVQSLFVACKRGNVELVEYLVHVCAAELEQRGVYEVQSLFVACKRGNVELVEYLVHVCAAELEQRGVYEVQSLFVACKRGNVELVEYLVHVCAAELEQRGVYEVQSLFVASMFVECTSQVPDERSVHSVTPLWCAAVAGRLGVLRALADAGAALDAGSDSGSTPVRSACFMTHVDVVRELLARGADPHRANHNGGTCLINSVQSVRLCTLLLDHGAAVDARDVQHKTALHYAIQEHRAETARLLLDHGADPHLRSRAGDDALRTAALKGAPAIVALLAARVQYPPAQLADGYELLGATQLDEFNDVAAALAAWRRATAVRHQAHQYERKRPTVSLGLVRALRGQTEWTTREELEAAAGDMDALRAQALLVAARVLGEQHKDTLLRLMYRGAAYGDAFRYQRCIDLWTWALEIRIEKDSLLYTDTCHTACAITRLMLDAHAGRLEGRGGGGGGGGDELPRHEDVVRVFTLVANHLPECQRALVVRPVYKKQAETFDRALRCATHLVHLLLVTAPPRAPHQARARRLVAALVAADVRSAHTGDTLLHLCVSRLNQVRSTYFAEEPATPPVFPSVLVARALLACGARVHTRNSARSTPLHVAAIPYNFSTELVEALLAGGAHLDQPNKFGDAPADLVQLNRGSRVRVLRHVTLACLAARALLRAYPALPPHALPHTLHAFLDLHRP